MDLELVREITNLKITEERYSTLKMYLELYFKNHTYMCKEELDVILKALEKEKEEDE